jgi:hypothetical protein
MKKPTTVKWAVGDLIEFSPQSNPEMWENKKLPTGIITLVDPSQAFAKAVWTVPPYGPKLADEFHQTREFKLLSKIT